VKRRDPRKFPTLEAFIESEDYTRLQKRSPNGDAFIRRLKDEQLEISSIKLSPIFYGSGYQINIHSADNQQFRMDIDNEGFPSTYTYCRGDRWEFIHTNEVDEVVKAAVTFLKQPQDIK